jgi:hypothetical protein
MELEPDEPQRVSIKERSTTSAKQAPLAVVDGDWKMTVEEFSFAGCHYNSSCD